MIVSFITMTTWKAKSVQTVFKRVSHNLYLLLFFQFWTSHKSSICYHSAFLKIYIYNIIIDSGVESVGILKTSENDRERSTELSPQLWIWWSENGQNESLGQQFNWKTFMPFAYFYIANQAAICSCQFYMKHNVYSGSMAWKEQELKKSRQLYQKSLKRN